MKATRWILLCFALLGLGGWRYLRQPWSPTQDLPKVQYTAVEVANTSGAGLATELRTWKGVTATTYNDNSGLLVVAHTNALPETQLLNQLSQKTSKPLAAKVFKIEGPQCPVPFGLIHQLPSYLLAFGLVTGFLWLLMTLKNARTL
jgi:hypothetical protein